MQPLRRLTNLTLGLVVSALLVGCSDAADVTGLPGSPRASVTVAFRAAAVTGGGSPALFAQELTLTDNAGNMLVITKAEMVVREVELKLQDDMDCNEQTDPDCDQFKTLPVLLELPLNGDLGTCEAVDGNFCEFDVQVDPGVYDEVHFDIHKLDDDNPDHDALLTVDPTLDKTSIRVEGTYTSSSGQGPTGFMFESDLNEEQKVPLPPGEEIDATQSSTARVTIEIDLDTWFRNANDTLVDPTTALKGATNENLIRDNIRDSIEGYRDDDQDGIRHGEDADEG